MASGNDIVTEPTTAQIEVIRQVLIKKGRPLSWESFGKEHEKCDSSVKYQSIRDALCRKSVHGILSSRDFITLDIPRNVALLKLQLVVAANEKMKGGRFTKASHYFRMITTDVEKDELGHNGDTLAKSILEYDDIFSMTSLSARGESNYQKVLLKPGWALLHKSYFGLEKDSKASAVHKFKYILFLCHGVTEVRI